MLEGVLTLNSVSISFAWLLFYDYFCTLGNEIEYVWQSRWSIGVPLFFCNRYLVFIDQLLLLAFALGRYLSEDVCGKLFQIGIWFMVVGGNVTSLIIYLQTCAIWGNPRMVIIPLGILQIGKFIASLVMTHLQWTQATFPSNEATEYYCGILNMNFKYVRYTYLLMCISEFITIGFTLVKAFQHLRHSSSSWVIQLYKNGILYCICIFLLSLANMIVSELPLKNPIFTGVLTRPQRVMESILCNRVMFVIFQYRKRFGRSRARRRRQFKHQLHPNHPNGNGDFFSGAPVNEDSEIFSGSDGDQGEGDSELNIFTSFIMTRLTTSLSLSRSKAPSQRHSPSQRPTPSPAMKERNNRNRSRRGSPLAYGNDVEREGGKEKDAILEEIREGGESKEGIRTLPHHERVALPQPVSSDSYDDFDSDGAVSSRRGNWIS